MDHTLYHKLKRQYLKEALLNSDKTPGSIHRALTEIAPPGRFSFNKEEKLRALKDLREAFEEHRHWPLDIVLSYIGITLEELQ